MAIDFHVLLTLIQRSWGIIGGGITIILLPIWLDPVEQGYYYTFSSLLALQIFFELGLNQIIMQIVSHEAAYLKKTAEGFYSGGENHLGRLRSILLIVQKWYLISAMLFVLICGAVGVYFFLTNSQETFEKWIWIWGTLTIATGINLWMSPRLAIMEGLGGIGQVARLRLFQSILGYILL